MSSKTKLIVSLSILAALLFTISPSSQIVEASPEQAVPSQFITLPAASFVVGHSIIYNRTWLLNSVQDGAEVYAPIVLPEGAILRKISISYIDNSATGRVKAEMRRIKVSDSSFSNIGTVESDLAGTSTSSQLMTMQVSKLINRYHFYTLQVTLDAGCSLYGVRVEYAMP